MPTTLSPSLFNIMQNPSVIGGPKTYMGIVNQKGFKQKYNAYIAEHKLIPFKVYYGDKVYFYHFKIDSSDGVTVYDVVIKMTENSHSHEGVIVNYDVQLFSNSPGFTYTYAYVYKKYKILVPELEDKFDANILEEAPMRTNPTQAIGFDYPIFFAMYYLYLHQFYLDKGDIRRRGKPLKEFDLNDVADCYEIIHNRVNPEDSEIKKFKDEAIRSVKNVHRAVKKDATKRVQKAISATSGIVKQVKTIQPRRALKKIVNRASKSSLVKIINKK